MTLHSGSKIGFSFQNWLVGWLLWILFGLEFQNSQNQVSLSELPQRYQQQDRVLAQRSLPQLYGHLLKALVTLIPVRGSTPPQSCETQVNEPTTNLLAPMTQHFPSIRFFPQVLSLCYFSILPLFFPFFDFHVSNTYLIKCLL